jgi:hypothetical protein
MQGVIRFVPLAFALLSACDRMPNSVAKSDVDKAAKPDETPAANCTSRAAFDIIRDQVFDAAIAKVEGKDATKLNSLRAVIAGRLEAPVVAGHDAAIGRTQCMGKIVFGLPPNTQKAFGDADALTANIDYAVQKAADGSGLVVEATGTEAMIESLVAGAKLKRIVPARIPEASNPRPLPIEDVFGPPKRDEPVQTDYDAPLPPLDEEVPANEAGL